MLIKFSFQSLSFFLGEIFVWLQIDSCLREAFILLLQLRFRPQSIEQINDDAPDNNANQ